MGAGRQPARSDNGLRKIARSLERVLSGSFAVPIIIKHSGNTERLIERLPKTTGFTMLSKFRMLSTLARPDDIAAIADLPGVERIFLNKRVQIPELPAIPLIEAAFSLESFKIINRIRTRLFNSDDINNAVPTSVTRRLLGADAANAEGFAGQGVSVAVIDTGSSHAFRVHPQIRKPVTIKSAFGAPTDTNGHGEFTSTIIFGGPAQTRTTEDKQIQVEGMAPAVTPSMIKALFTPGGAGTDSSIIRGIEIALDLGADVINLSLGSSPGDDDPDDDPLVAAIEALPPNIIVVAASGNDGSDRVGSPATAKNAISVGALDTRTNKVAGFSNRGNDLIGPGVDILSGTQTGTLMDITGKATPGFAVSSGTSFSTPHVSGMIAIAKQFSREKFNHELTWMDVLEIAKSFGQTKSDDRGYGLLTWDMIKQFNPNR